jgi:outer membrane protein OmpA-like peptidoglycan-associated protein
MDGVAIPAMTDFTGLPPAPVSVSATRRVREGARVQVELPPGSAGVSVQGTVITVRDKKDNVAARVVVETPPGQELAVVTVPYVGPGFKVTAYNINAHGVSTGAFITSPLVRSSTLRDASSQRLAGSLAGKPIRFAHCSADLDRGDKRALRSMARQIKGTLGVVYVTGFAGRTSDTDKPRAMSMERARAVAEFLASRGVRVWIRFDGLGDRLAKGRERDRRVEVRFRAN